MFFSLATKRIVPACAVLRRHVPALLMLLSLSLNSSGAAYELRGQVSLSGGRYSAYNGGLIDPTARLSTQADVDLVELIPNLDFRLSFEAASNSFDVLDNRGIEQNQAQVLIAYARYMALHNKLVLDVGRQSLYGGAASLAGAGMLVDGISARGHMPAGLRGRAFVGLLSSPLLVDGFGDVTTGAHVYFAPPGLPMSLSAQALYSADPAENMAESLGLVGLAADARPANWLRVAMRGSYDVLNLELAELSVSYIGNLRQRWQASLFLGHLMPSALIRKSSMFASFSLHSYDTLRLSLGYAPRGAIRGEGGFSLQRERDAELSGRVHLRSIFSGMGGVTGMAELAYTSARPQAFVGPSRLIQEFNSGFASLYMSLAAPLSPKLGLGLLASAWVQLLVFDQPIYDQLIAVDLGLSLQRRIWQNLDLQAYFSLSQHPLAGLDPRALLQLRYHFDLRASSPLDGLVKK